MANADKWSGTNPWLGLASYSENETLYGRDKETAVLADVIKNNIATTVFGKSGVGKSSLISAGISPRLNEERYVPVKIRLVHNSDVSYVEQIENAVREKVVCIDNLPSTIGNLGLWDFFHRHSFTTVEGEDCTPVVILDQFEEIFTLTDEEHKPCIREFFQNLSSLLNNIKPDNVKEAEKHYNVAQTPASSVGIKKLVIKRVGSSAFQYSESIDFRFVVCLREDKLYLLERNSANIPALKTNRFNLQALSPEKAMEVIMRPRPDLFTDTEATAIIDKLADMGDEGVRTLDPAILSLFLYKYFEKRGTANADNIFADYYSDATKDINSKSIAFLENHLLTLGGYRNQIPLDDALSSGVSQGEIESLHKSVILRTEKRKGIDYIEFSHDRLCAEAKKNREERIMREQARKVRKRMMLSVLIFAISAAMLGGVLWLTFKLQTSEEGRLSEKQQKELFKEMNDSLALLDSMNRRQKDSLLILNEKNLAQNKEIERQRDELGIKNKELKAQLAKNEEQLVQIKEQQRKIEELQSGTVEEQTIINREAGKLSVELPYNALLNLTSLTISGNLNGTDIKYLRDGITKLKHLNLHDANIVEGGNAYAQDYKGEYLTDNDVVGKSMFSGLKSLETIILPQNITFIGEDAFSGCVNLISITIPNSVSTIGDGAFRRCEELTSVILPNNITSIEPNLFSSCSKLKSINIPNSVTSIGKGAFSSCSNLISFNIPNGVTTIDTHVFYYCTELKSINIPNSVTSIGIGAFEGCSKLKSISIPDSVTSICESAFKDCSGLEFFTIPNSVTAIGKSAFYECSSLKSITIPNSVKYIGDWAFWSCTFDIFINNSSCTNKKLWGAKLTETASTNGFVIHDNVLLRYIGKNSSVTIPNGITEIGHEAFRDCSNITSVIIPNSVISIGDHAFNKCSKLKSVTIPNSVTSIGKYAFCNCSSLTSVILPKSVTKISESTFSSCRNLKSVTIPNGVTTIGDGAFDCCLDLTSVTIPQSVTIIGDYAFDNSGLTTINIPNSVMTIGKSAFSECDSLSSVVIPNSVRSIGAFTFAHCQSLTSVTIPNSVTEIGGYAFERSGLTTINIPNSVMTIGNFAFYSCSSLTSVVIPNSVRSIGDYAFNKCSKLRSITIPNNVQSIGASAFQDCSGLTSVSIPNKAASIGISAFEGCTSLMDIYCNIDHISQVSFETNNNKCSQFTNIPEFCTWHVPNDAANIYKSQPWWVPSWIIVEGTKNRLKTSYNNGILKINDIKYNMLPVEGGTFMMGTSDDMIAAGYGWVITEKGDTMTFYGSERPVHEVTLDDYRIGETEVTQALWTAVMGYNPSENKGDNLPVDNVSWNDCLYFIHKLNSLTGMNFRLPTEAEWEFAARGGNKSKHTFYSGSNNPFDVGWFEENSGGKTHPVKQKQPNELGLYDMSGNVCEFCQDIGTYPKTSQINPKAVTRSPECIRGGESLKIGYVSSRLNITDPNEKGYYLGLRLVINSK